MSHDQPNLNSQYDQEYFEYLLNRSSFQKWARKLLFKPLAKYLRGTVLDLGCGIGEVSDLLAIKSNYIGVEINPFCVDYLQKNGLNARQGSADQIPAEDCSVDTVLCSHLLEHLETPDQTLREIYRVLRPGGTLIIIVPMLNGFRRDRTHRIFYKPADLKRLAAQNRFAILKIIHSPIPFDPLGNLFYFFEYRMIAQKN